MDFFKKYSHFVALSLVIVTFFSFGMFHLTKFETVDEHFWKYDRIEKYWNGIHQGVTEGIWKKTSINDKPGVTVGIVSGIGSFFEPPLEDHIILKTGELTQYDTERTERMNFALRFPILLLNTLFLVYFFWIFRKIIHNRWLAVLATGIIALTPTLIGISQVINPDAFLWSFASAAFFTYIAFLQRQKLDIQKKLIFWKEEKKIWQKRDWRGFFNFLWNFYLENKLIILTGGLLGLALLSKYTANLLFPIFFISFLAYGLFAIDKTTKRENVWKFLRRNTGALVWIFIIASVVYSILMPAALENPKYWYRGTIGSATFEAIFLPLAVIGSIFLIDLVLFRSRGVFWTLQFLRRARDVFVKIPALILTLLFVFLLVNAWSGEFFVDTTHLKETVYSGEEVQFSMVHYQMPVFFEFQQLAIETHNFFFSLMPVIVVFLLMIWLKITVFGAEKKYKTPIFIIMILPLVYFFGALLSDVFVNQRYAIMLYPLFGGMIVFGLVDIATFWKKKHAFNPKLYWGSIALVLVINSFWALCTIKPFYFNYTSSLLPKQYIATDAWGLGSYEAAMYLNSLPQAEDLTIWSDRTTVCQFFVGKCVHDRQINQNKTPVDYFVMARRGYVTKQFTWDDYDEKHSNNYYYSPEVFDNPEWELYIGDRPGNFVKVIKSQE